MGSTVIFSRDELDLIVELACSLNEKPGKNWVEGSGGLPEYICRIARAIKRSGKTTSQAIAIAVSRVKKWAAGGDDVDADTRAKAAKAVAQWEALKAKNKAKTKRKGNAVAASHTGEPEILCLANVDFNVDIVRRAFENQTRDARKTWRSSNPNANYDDGPPHWWIKEQWTNYLIVSKDYGSDTLYKVPYEVSTEHDVSFSDPIEVKTQYVVVDTDDVGSDVNDADLQKLLAATHDDSCAPTPLDRLVLLAAAPKKPYGNVTYADPGYNEGKKRYPIDTAAHVRAAWSYINQADNAGKYTPEQVAAIKAKIKSAAKKLGVSITDGD